MSSRKVEIKGTPVFELCNKRNDVLRDRYMRLESEENQLREEIKERERRIAEIRGEYKNLNIAEVYEVLAYVRTYLGSNNLQHSEADSLLCHCQNKLNGNINSIFLRFDNPVEEKADENKEKDNK